MSCQIPFPSTPRKCAPIKVVFLDLGGAHFFCVKIVNRVWLPKMPVLGETCVSGPHFSGAAARL